MIQSSKNRILYGTSVLIFCFLIGTSIHSIKEAREAEAVTVAPLPFGGQIASVEVCCNGIKFSTTGQYQSPIYGTFIMEWPKMIPNPAIGLGLYSWWSITSSEKTIGSAIPSGVCITVASECETSQAVTYSVNQMGTTLIGV